MKTATRDEFERVAGQINEMMNNLWQWHTGDFCPVDTWTPAINIYRFPARIEVCVDLAGVTPSQIVVRVERGSLVIRGIRQPPEPSHKAGETMRIEAMEIDHGRFCRTIPLPELVDLTRIEPKYADGYLWIRIPLRQPG